MAVWPGWGWIDAWQYSAVLREFAEDKDFFETTPPPRTAICEDMQHWDG